MIAAERPGTTVNQSSGRRVQRRCYIQTTGSRQCGFMHFLSNFRDVATEYLEN